MSDADPFDKLQPWQERRQHIDRMNSGFAPMKTGFEPALDKEIGILESQAKSYVFNEAFERMLRWREADDVRWDALDPQTRLQVGYYVQAKTAARRLGSIS